MRRVAALLAAALVATALLGCGGGGAEPGAPKGATLVLDFQPNAVHAGIYAAQANGDFKDEGIDLHIQEPSTAADSAKLLETGRADFAVMDISDFGIARERGFDLAAFASVVQRPLAAVIARDRDQIRSPADLAGKTIGVTGVPSDDAVLDTVLRAGGVDPSSVNRVTIGFNAVADLAAGKVDAATAFWNAEGVELQQQGIPIREFRVDELGAPRYPELVIAVSHKACPIQDAFMSGLSQGYHELSRHPDTALGALLEQVPSLDRASQQAQLNALLDGHAFDRAGSLDKVDYSPPLNLGIKWLNWAIRNGVVSSSARQRVAAGFQAGDFCA